MDERQRRTRALNSRTAGVLFFIRQLSPGCTHRAVSRHGRVFGTTRLLPEFLDMIKMVYSTGDLLLPRFD